MSQDEVQRLSERITALFETMRAFAEVATDVPLLLETIAERMTRFMGEGCAVFLQSEDGVWLRPAAIYNRDEAARDVLRAAFSSTSTRVDGDSVMAQALRTGHAIATTAVEPTVLARRFESDDPARIAEALGRAHVQRLLCVPLHVHGKALGALSLSRHGDQAEAFSEEDRAFAQSLADHAALALSNAELVESLKTELAERARAQEETRKFVGLVQHSDDFIAMAGIDGTVLFVNDAGRALLGIPMSLDVSSLPLAAFHTEDGMKRAAVIRATGRWRGEGHLRHFATGELIPTQVSSFLIRDPGGNPFGFATVQRDLRETKRLEAHLRQMQKMDAVGRLAGGIAHDFNNLLSVILSYSGMMKEALPPASPFFSDVEEIHTAGERAAALTHQLLAFSRQQVLEPRVEALDTILDGMDRMTRRLLGEDVELRVELGSGLAKVKVDRGQIEQVVMNLAVNARDAMPQGGKLTFTTSTVKIDPSHPTMTGVAPGAYVLLSVSDTGEGMDAKTLERIFEPFYTTKPVGKGTGLGLATVFGVVQQSGGHVSVESEVGKGTTFQVLLPRAGEECEAAPDVRSVAEGAPTGVETILLVEDDLQVRSLMRGVLRRGGYRVLEAPGAEEAASINDRFGGHIHLLVTDVVMPRMNGRKLAKRVRLSRPDTKVLYVSGHTADAIGRHGVVEDDMVLLRKPITPTGLLVRVREVLDAPIRAPRSGAPRES